MAEVVVSTDYFCPACLRTVPEFATGPGGRPGARCPKCQALERHRFLAYLLRRLSPFTLTARAVLDIAPQRRIRGLLREQTGSRYVGLDRFEERGQDLQGDITQLPFADGAFDFVLCYHVLEHIPDDYAAMGELRRILSPGGMMLVQVPRRVGRPTDEDPSAAEEERVRRFGQADHVRWYGDDFETRLASKGLRSTVLLPRMFLSGADVERIGVQPDQMVWLCRADVPRAAPAPFFTDDWKGEEAVLSLVAGPDGDGQPEAQEADAAAPAGGASSPVATAEPAAAPEPALSPARLAARRVARHRHMRPAAAVYRMLKRLVLR